MPEFVPMVVKLHIEDESIRAQLLRGDPVTVILQHTGYRDGTEAELRITRA